MDDVWPMVHAERAALIADLERLDDRQWDVPSLCAGWTVRDVVAHLIDTAKTTRLGFVIGLARARFDFHLQNARGVERERGASPAGDAGAAAAVTTRTSTPPVPLDSRFVEEVVHGEDIRRPLGSTRAYPQDMVVRALRLQTRRSGSIRVARRSSWPGSGWRRRTPISRSATGPRCPGPFCPCCSPAAGRWRWRSSQDRVSVRCPGRGASGRVQGRPSVLDHERCTGLDRCARALT